MEKTRSFKIAGLVLTIIVASAGSGFLLSGEEGTVLSGRAFYKDGGKKIPVDGALIALEGVSEDISSVSRKDPVMDQVNQTFTPHVIYAIVGQKVTFKNSEMIVHNVRIRKGNVTLFDKNTYPMQSISHVFEDPGVYRVVCDIHPSMLGFVYVKEKPYIYTRTDSGGRFSFQVPHQFTSVQLELHGWEERLGLSGSIKVDISSDSELDSINLALQSE